MSAIAFSSSQWPNLVFAGLRVAGLALTVGLGTASAEYYNVLANAAALTNIAVDGKCNLTEAVKSFNLGQPINSDCVPIAQNDRYLFLMGANTVYQIAAGTVISTQFNITAEVAGVVIEAAGTPFSLQTGAYLSFSGSPTPLTIRVKSGSVGNAIYNSGSVLGYKAVFQGGNISGILGESGYGGVIFNRGSFAATNCTIQGGTAVLGGGIYNMGTNLSLYNTIVQNNTATDAGGGIYTIDGNYTALLEYSTIQNNIATKRGGGIFMNAEVDMHNCTVKGNKAGQGGGIFNLRKDTDTNPPSLILESSTVSDNKAIASEVTPIPGPSGTVVTGTGTQCSASETPNQAFDDSFGTKWCTNGSAAPGNNGNAVILTYDFPGTSTQTVAAYSITSANDSPSRDPADWTFEGYNGTTWVVLHTVTNWTRFHYPEAASPARRFFTESFNAYAVSNPNPPQPANWRFTNATAYQAYRLRITRNAGSDTRTQLAELQLYLDGRTGDGGGIFAVSRLFLKTSTISGNIAGCVNANCACTAAWCASTSNTSPAMGKGGGLYGGNPTPESFVSYMTVAGNSASQGGGVYLDHDEDGEWEWSLVGKNSARTGSAPEPDFHGNPHDGGPRHGSFFQNTAGINVFPSDDPNSGFARGLVLSGTERDYTGDPLLNVLADNGGPSGFAHTWTHALQAGSPARDKAISGVPGTGDTPLRDQRGSGYPRQNGAFPDLGAYEY